MAGTISSAGIGSGIDVNSIITKLMNAEQIPLNMLKAKEASYTTKLTAFGSLKGAFSSLETAVQGLNSTSLFKTMSATSSNTSVISASANTAAAAGDYNIDVVARAQGESIASASFSSLTTNQATADGQIKIEFGTTTTTTVNGVTTPTGFTADAAKSPVTINISQGTSSLSAIRDAINNANAGVTARIVDVGSSDGSGASKYKLVISSNGTGANSSMRITTWDSAGTTQLNNNQGLAQFSFDPAATANTGNEYSLTGVAQDAHLKINNLDVYRSTNTISDAITGVTLSLASTGSTTLSVKKDTGAVKTALEAFVKAYNGAVEEVHKQTSYDATNKKASALTGDSGARSLQTALQQMLSFTVKTESSSVKTFSDIGITIQKDGTLEFDSSKLDSALSANPNAVAELVTNGYSGSSSLAKQMSVTMNSIMGVTGILATSTDGINRTITDIRDAETAMEIRLAAVEKNYQAAFAAMDSTVSSWNSTSSYLTQQFDALNGTSSSKNK